MACRHDEGMNSRISKALVSEGRFKNAKRMKGTLAVERHLAPDGVIVPHEKRVDRTLATATRATIVIPPSALSPEYTEIRGRTQWQRSRRRRSRG